MARQQPRNPKRLHNRTVLSPGWTEADLHREGTAFANAHPWCWNCGASADCAMTIATDYGTYTHYNFYVLCEACYDNPQIQARLAAEPPPPDLRDLARRAN